MKNHDLRDWQKWELLPSIFSRITCPRADSCSTWAYWKLHCMRASWFVKHVLSTIISCSIEGIKSKTKSRSITTFNINQPNVKTARQTTETLWTQSPVQIDPIKQFFKSILDEGDLPDFDADMCRALMIKRPRGGYSMRIRYMYSCLQFFQDKQCPKICNKDHKDSLDLYKPVLREEIQAFLEKAKKSLLGLDGIIFKSLRSIQCSI